MEHNYTWIKLDNKHTWYLSNNGSLTDWSIVYEKHSWNINHCLHYVNTIHNKKIAQRAVENIATYFELVKYSMFLKDENLSVHNNILNIRMKIPMDILVSVDKEFTFDERFWLIKNNFY